MQTVNTPKTSMYRNPFRPGAGHLPPYLAGRSAEQEEMRKLLSQDTITDNAVITGLRGVGKTVLLESLKPIALESGWLWAGTDLSESACISEDAIAMRLLVDTAAAASSVLFEQAQHQKIGYLGDSEVQRFPLSYETLKSMYRATPGLVSDKLKHVLEQIWKLLKNTEVRGIVFAYDEAQNLSDHKQEAQYPLSALLEVFQSLQRKGIPFMLLFVGLPTLFPKLVEARTYAERMFHVMTLSRLDEAASREAILRPVEGHPIQFGENSVNTIVTVSGGYPYFLQYICKEVYDLWIAKVTANETLTIPIENIIRKLDSDFFQGRWSQTTDRQKDLLRAVVALDSCDDEFTGMEVSNKSKELPIKPFSPSHVIQMLNTLSDRGLVFRNRFGKYSLAVPLLSNFIRRQYD